jgi:glycosyltransferase EpsD
MKKVLFVATITGHIKSFHIPYLKWFKEQGYEVHVASSGDEEIPYCDKHFNLNFARFPIKLQNIKVYKELKNIIEENKYEIIHCHTPVGGVITRLAARNARKKYNTKVIYTAHGFHFYKGAPAINWIIYYPIEKWLARYTDCLITINQEDYERAKRKIKKSKAIKHVHGVGFNTERLNIIPEENYKEEMNCNKDDIVFSYVAEINKNKNQKMIVKCIKQIKNDYPNIKVLLAGKDNSNGKLEELVIEEGLQDNIIILGNRDDVGKLLSITDIYLATSLREGLPVNIMEAMYKKLPIIAMNNRGHRALIENGKSGIIIENEKMMKEKIIELIEDKNFRKQLGDEAFKTSKKYSIEKVIIEMENIYSSYI